MNPKGKPSLSELKVGVFVLITCVILGTAIFTIGTQVGLLEDTFYARTYLNNVSGLKPGDIVLLAGVEVGNVTDVQISPADEVPPTQSNQILITRIELWAQQLQELEELDKQIQERQDTFLQKRCLENAAVSVSFFKEL